MKEKLLALLTAKFSGARKDVLSQLARVLALQAADDDGAKALVDKITDAQVKEFTKDYRADVDKEVSESNKTFEATLRKKYDFKEKDRQVEPGNPPAPKKDERKGGDDLVAIIKAELADALKPVNDTLNAFKAANAAKSRLQALEEKLKDCKDDSFKEQTLKDFARMSFSDDNNFNEYLTDKEKDIAAANQRVADDALRNGGGSPLFSQKEESGISVGVADYLKSRDPKNQLTGKEV